jgi:hypothetical protein
MRRAFWREYLRLFIFPLGGTTDFGRRKKLTYVNIPAKKHGASSARNLSDELGIKLLRGFLAIVF